MGVSPRLDELRKRYEENPRRFFAPLANEYRKSGDVERAIQLCETHVAEAPANLSGQIVLGQSLFDAGRYEDARQPFSVAVQLDPENLIALRHLGDIARFLGSPGEAAGWYQRVLEADPRNDEIGDLLREMQAAQTTAPRTMAPPAAVGPIDSNAPEPAMPMEPADGRVEGLATSQSFSAPERPALDSLLEAVPDVPGLPSVGRLSGYAATTVEPEPLAHEPLELEAETPAPSVADASVTAALDDDLPVHEIDLDAADAFGFARRDAVTEIDDRTVTAPPTVAASEAPSLLDIEAAFAMPEVGTFADASARESGSASLTFPPADLDATSDDVDPSPPELGSRASTAWAGSGAVDGLAAVELEDMAFESDPLATHEPEAGLADGLGFSDLPDVPVDSSVQLAPLDEAVDDTLGFEMLEEPEPAAFSTYDDPAAAHPDAALLGAILTVPPVPAPAPEGVELLDEALLDVDAFGGGATAPAVEPELLPEDSAAATPVPTATFATETMAELYLRQGLVAEAIGVYEALLQQRPGDSALQAKLASLRPEPAAMQGHQASVRTAEPRAVEFFAALAFRAAVPSARRSAEPVADGPGDAQGVDLAFEASPAVAVLEAAPDRHAAPSWLDDAPPLAVAAPSASAAAEVAAPTAHAGHAVLDVDEEARAALFATAFAPLEAAAPPPPAPDTAAAPPPSAVTPGSPGTSLEGDAVPARPSTTIKFDQFFAATPRATPPAAPAPPPSAAPAPGPTASDDDFQSWLSGLTKS